MKWTTLVSEVTRKHYPVHSAVFLPQDWSGDSPIFSLLVPERIVEQYYQRGPNFQKQVGDHKRNDEVSAAMERSARFVVGPRCAILLLLNSAKTVSDSLPTPLIQLRRTLLLA